MAVQHFETLTGKRYPLVSNWQLCATPPGYISQLSDLEQITTWLTLPTLGPVAAVLRQLGQWSLDGSPRRFDAEDWWYRLRFNLSGHKPDGNTILGFDGLATLAEVWLNGERLLSSNNMFIEHQLPVGKRLLADANELVICFGALDSYLAQRRSRPRWRVPMLEHQQLRRVRTTLLGRTPGWSPPAAVVGPWRGVWWEQNQPIVVRDLTLRPTLDGTTGLLAITCSVVSVNKDSSPIERVVLELTRKHQHTAIDLLHDGQDGLFAAELQVDPVELWWPHTHGESALYQALLRVKRAELTEWSAFELGSIGFRTVAIVAEAAHFSVHINGIPVFCRGACWTPLDPVTLDVSPERYSSAITQVREAGMNMLRVSGTMTYEAEAFYAACAEQGIMVWQEFMFASMDYPHDADFVASVTLEAEQQLTCWQANPALTVLCGNSEVEQQAAMWGAPRDYWAPALFHEVLADIAKKLCPNVPYWPSSTHGGTFPHQNNAGTASYYGVGAYLRPLEDARRSQVAFATECLAFANVPELANMQQIHSPSGLIKVHHPRWKERVPRDLGAGWDFEDVRDYYLAQIFGIDPLNLRYADHERYLLLSRVASGEVMAATFNEWRSSYSNCHGGLVWLLRDLWPGAGWGVLDSMGDPKAAYFYLKRVLQPLSVSISDEGNNGLYAHIVHEGATPLPIEFIVTVYKSGQRIVATSTQSLTLTPRDNLAYSLMNTFDHFMDLSNAYRFGPPIADTIHVQLRSPQSKILCDAFHFPLGLSKIPLIDVGLQATVRMLDDGDARVTVQCNRVALSVYFEVEGFIPADAYFHLVPGTSKTVKMRATKKTSGDMFGYIGAINAPELAAIKVEI
jgi:beta-mannosidase